jgi:hypothetical protein
MFNEVNEFINNAFLVEKAKDLIEALGVLDGFGMVEANEDVYNIVMSSGDREVVATVGDVEDTVVKHLETALALHGVNTFSTTTHDVNIMLTTLNAILSIPTYSDRESILSAMEDAEGDTTDILLDVIEVMDPSIPANGYYETILSVSPALLDKIKELYSESEDVTSESSMVVNDYVRDRLQHEHAKDLPLLQKHLGNNGSLRTELQSLLTMYQDYILDTIEEERHLALLATGMISTVKDNEVFSRVREVMGEFYDDEESTIRAIRRLNQHPLAGILSNDN